MISINPGINPSIGQRITLDALSYYAPIYQDALKAEKKLESDGGTMGASEYYGYLAISNLKEMAADRVMFLAYPLVRREINKLIENSYLPYSEDLFSSMFFAAYEGVMRALESFNSSKAKSPTNYIFQWVFSHIKREILIHETPPGMSVAKFEKLKRIAAVRSKLSAELGYPATDSEVLEYFQSGKANLKTKHGRVGASESFNMNKSITLELIREQSEFAASMLAQISVEALEDEGVEVVSSTISSTREVHALYGNTVSLFVASSNLTDKAAAVARSEYSPDDVTTSDLQILRNMDSKEYRRIAHYIKVLLRDKGGPFYEFLESNKDDESCLLVLSRTKNTDKADPNIRKRYVFLFRQIGEK